MSEALNAVQRSALNSLVQKGRSLLENDLRRTLEGEYGIHSVGGRIEDITALALDTRQTAIRADLLGIITFLRSEGESAHAAVDRVVREAAFTHLNRFIALRVAEALGLMPAAIAEGIASQGFRDFCEVAPASADEDWERFRLFLHLCADELSSDAPALFDPRNPLLELEPSITALAQLITLIVDSDDAVWSAPDALGWSYQFFNSGAERREMRDSQAPRSSRELAVRNQFFTPSYVVDFLVENGLGAHLARHIEGFDRKFPLMVKGGSAETELDLTDVSVLDPACGSGHFLLGAYDVLEAAWRSLGVEPADAAPHIVRSLWGIDIDPRATQIAQAAVIFRARRSCKASLPRPNVICARSLPLGAESESFLNELPEHVNRAVRSIAEELTSAPVLGPLLKIEKRLDQEARDLFGTGQIAGSLAETVDLEVVLNVRSQVIQALAEIADSTTSSASARVFAAEAHDAVRFVEAMGMRFTAVLMNPPFGLCVESTQDFLRGNYDGWTDLYACFVERGRELCAPGGSLGVLMPNTFFNTRKMRKTRESILKAHDLALVVDLGPGVLEDAAVEVAALVLRHSDQIRYLDLVETDADSRAQELAGFEASATISRPSDFLSDDGRHLLTFRRQTDHDGGTPTLEPTHALVRTGGNTFDNFRFVRLWWEVQGSREEIDGWPPYFKGGDYFPYSFTTRLRLDWRSDGDELRAFGSERGVLPQVMQSSKHWGKPGLSYPRAGKKFGAIVMPSGGIFAEKSVAILPNDGTDSLVLLGLLNSSPTANYFDEIGRGRFVENSWVKNLPIATHELRSVSERVRHLVERIVASVAAVDSLDETSPDFVGFPSPSEARRFVDQSGERVRELQVELDRLAEPIVGRPANEQHAQEVSAAIQTSLGDDVSLLIRWLSSKVGECFGRWTDGDPIQLITQDPLSDSSLSDLVTARVASSTADDPELALMLSDVLGRKGIEEFFRTKFFKHHLALYSMSRRKAPIYWLLQVPSRKWGVWLYMPELSRETLFAVVRVAEDRQRLADRRIGTLQREYDEGGAGRTAAAVARELDAEQKLSVELATFRDEADRIANLGWEPDLDDGAVLNAAPLASLFPAWTDAAKYRDDLRTGGHTWATVAQFAKQL